MITKKTFIWGLYLLIGNMWLMTSNISDKVYCGIFGLVWVIMAVFILIKDDEE